ncbi:hypothetical protein N0V93_000031 [Gnomoniopsis smithogilvyi]|uniref:Bilirubin oxidase n=1 Tax=Gnomoniopsis smithogilvyi TaxID=1191159 RepID=A0A9W8Z378_9PEZI|nr:hypothetical protein N0V93_000031 [Gnomoniopsis smithogilvyi]
MARTSSQILAFGATLCNFALAGVLPPQPRAILPPFSPEYPLYSAPLKIPPLAVPLTNFTDESGKTIDAFEVDIREFTEQIYPIESGVGPTTFVGYNGMVPGPTFSMTRGREAVVRFTNSYTRNSSIHLHGSYSRAPWDGWAEDVTPPGFYKDYYYPNGQPQRTLWYHDHAIDLTALNVGFGQAGFYVLHDPDPNQDFGLPTEQYDVPLMIVSKKFNADGTLYDFVANAGDAFGDVITVNGIPWPFFEVEPRKYRFRLLDASVTRSYLLHLADEADPTVDLPFTVVGADAGLLSHPVDTFNLSIAMAERYEVVIDFSLYQGKTLLFQNTFAWQTNPDYPNTDKVMKFVVGDTVTDTKNNGPIPAKLATLKTPSDRTTIDHSFVFDRNAAGHWSINNVTFDDVTNRILAKPQQGEVERWQLRNLGTTWSHPIHIHLVDFQVASRVGPRPVEPYEAAALKDVVYLGTNETLEVIANYQPWAGVYMFHCHNLQHEDNGMMGAFNATSVNLTAFGYPDNATFADPMAGIWRSRPILSTTSIQDMHDNVLPMFIGLGAYPNADAVEDALAHYYAESNTTATDGIPPNV